jgi:hypothetical protein
MTTKTTRTIVVVATRENAPETNNRKKIEKEDSSL